ncbi:aminodeoxychorismate synthase, component I [Virgibacillus phasianinus]|uniref:Aminodeoxychorismate synthase, component I n=1 Tax=Virgibacillus phasianinus TaxID=2017483 RepID=A0A220TZ36_9BACI|nr:aminodeoxychorismate synthase component I [Virgibacillus phasianinus]ASK61039.1 aminodeoxychorismate synthase, component I [Virgibacillus phasianinus]
MKPQNPELFFNFKDTSGTKKPVMFKDPIDIISTSNIDEVLPYLERVQDYVNAGYYAAGYLAYEAAPAFEPEFKVNTDGSQTLLWYGIFTKPTYESLSSAGDFSIKEWTASEPADHYQKSIEHIKNLIELGDTYQVNYTIRMNSTFTGDTKAYYTQLAQAQAADYSAFIQTADHTILSASPELFFQMCKGKITTRPMKGTAQRGLTYKEDNRRATWLAASEKNRAENVMIVDLLRNDLGTIAKPGTVQVPKLFSIEKYPTVYQMTSTITATTEEDISLTDVFKALFPCGSITGAPKISTMRIIQELETSPRGVYCGAIGYITPEQEAIFNVPIRTVTIDHEDNCAKYGVGGGITWDSTSEGEYDEIITKSALLKRKQPEFQLLESIGLVHGSYLVLENHMERLEKSAWYFNFSIDIEEIRKELMKCASTHSNDKWKVRLLVDQDGQFTCEAVQIIHDSIDEVTAVLANAAVSSEDVFLYHKTTNRSVYKKAKASHPDVYDVLLWNEKKEVTEFTAGNVVMQINDQFFTPPIECGLLGGTFRKKLIDSGKIAERIIRVDELKDCECIWFINSVREWIPVKLHEKRKLLGARARQKKRRHQS